jgi:hypothetical protein
MHSLETLTAQCDEGYIARRIEVNIPADAARGSRFSDRQVFYSQGKCEWRNAAGWFSRYARMSPSPQGPLDSPEGSLRSGLILTMDRRPRAVLFPVLAARLAPYA